jgi:hypothetical protein
VIDGVVLMIFRDRRSINLGVQPNALYTKVCDIGHGVPPAGKKITMDRKVEKWRNGRASHDEGKSLQGSAIDQE